MVIKFSTYVMELQISHSICNAAPYSEALKNIRMSEGMSQRAFAEHIGVIQSYIL